MGAPKKQNPMTNLNVVMTPQQHKWLEDISKKTGKSKSELVRAALVLFQSEHPEGR